METGAIGATTLPARWLAAMGPELEPATATIRRNPETGPLVPATPLRPRRALVFHRAQSVRFYLI